MRLQGCRRDPLGRRIPMTDESRRPFCRSRIEAVERDCEPWVALHAQAGVPELVLVGILRDSADTIERRGVIPRSLNTMSYESQHSARRHRRR